MKKLFENFRHFLNEGDLSAKDKAYKKVPYKHLNKTGDKKKDTVHHK